MKPRWAFPNPSHKFLQSGMGAQGCNRIVVPRQFRLGQRDMDLIVANLMKQHDRATLSSFQLRGQMVQALPRIRRDGALTQRANRIVHEALRQLRRALIRRAICDAGQIACKLLICGWEARHPGPSQAMNEQKVRHRHHIAH